MLRFRDGGTRNLQVNKQTHVSILVANHVCDSIKKCIINGKHCWYQSYNVYQLVLESTIYILIPLYTHSISFNYIYDLIYTLLKNVVIPLCICYQNFGAHYIPVPGWYHKNGDTSPTLGFFSLWTSSSSTIVYSFPFEDDILLKVLVVDMSVITSLHNLCSNFGDYMMGK